MPTVFPGSVLGIPPDLLGPTGNVFIHDDGSTFSTELGVVVDHPSGKGFTYTPLLVPGQKDVDALLSGEKPTKQQIGIAREWASKAHASGANLPAFPSPEKAVAAEKTRHEGLQTKLLGYLQPFLGQSLGNFNPPAREAR